MAAALVNRVALAALPEPVVREMAPGLKAHLWGYNGQSPGPTIEVVEGDRIQFRAEENNGALTLTEIC